MIHFCITNDDSLIKNHHCNLINLKNFKVSFGNSVFIYEDSIKLVLFCGILWNGHPLELADNKISLPNGQFYCVIFNKQDETIKIITDFIEDFAIYYQHIDNKILITSQLINIKNTQLNNTWFRNVNERNVYQDRFFSSIPSVKNKYNSSHTIFKNVFRIGAMREFLYSIKGNTCSTNTYHPNTYFIDAFKKETIDFDTAVEIIDTTLLNNIKQIKNKYPNIVLQASSGIDSVLLYKYLLPDIKTISYLGTWWKKEKITSLDNHHQILKLTQEEYLKASHAQYPNWILPTKQHDLLIEMHTISKINKDYIIIDGSYGDEVFWHDCNIALASLFFKYKFSYEEAVQFLKEKKCYSYQVMEMDKSFYETTIKTCKSLQHFITWLFYYRNSYLQDLRGLTNRLILSPYIDVNLHTLLNKCTQAVKEKSIFNAELQFDLLPLDLQYKVNKFKIGGEEGSHLINRKFSIPTFLKNYKAYHAE